MQGKSHGPYPERTRRQCPAVVGQQGAGRGAPQLPQHDQRQMGGIRQAERPGGAGPHGIQPGGGLFRRFRRRGLRQLPGGQQQTVPHRAQAFQTGGSVAEMLFQLHGQFRQG